MKRFLPGIILSSIICCLLLFSPGTLAGQTVDGKPVSGKTSVSDSLAQNLSQKIKIYPVPAKSELIIDNIEGVTMIEILDVTGNKRINEVCENHSQLIVEVSQLKKGFYFIRFISPRVTVMKRFIKE
jgi:hypothetical protein